MAIATISVALISLVTIFGSGSRHAVMTRNRTAAILTAQSLMEEVTVHPYGAPAPKMWPVDSQDKFEYNVWVEGKKQEMVFTRSVKFTNGSAIGNGAGEPWDRATITVTWEEYDPAAKGGKQEQKQVVAEATVWRQGAFK